MINISRKLKFERRIRVKNPMDALRLDVGCGRDLSRRNRGFVGIDIIDYGQDVVWDVEDGLPVQDSSVEEIFCSHTFEHLDDWVGVLNEFHRVLKKDGEVHVVVPGPRSTFYHAPTHVNFFTINTFEYFDAKAGQVAEYGIKPWNVRKLVENDRGDIHCILQKP